MHCSTGIGIEEEEEEDDGRYKAVVMATVLLCDASNQNPPRVGKERTRM